MFEKIGNFFNKMMKPEVKELASKDAAKERLHLVLMQDRANVSVDFLELMKQEIIDVIKKYIVVDESAIDVRLTNQENEDGTNGAPSLYANIPIINIKNDVKAEKIKDGTLMYENGELEKAPTDEHTEQQTLEEEVTTKVEPENVEEEKVETVQEQVSEEVIELGAPQEENIQEIEPEEAKVQETQIEEVEAEESLENTESSNETQEEIVIEKEEEEEIVEPVIDFSDDEELDDEDDEDVTFDDLLKKAEEEEANNKIETSEVKEKKTTPKKKKSSNKKKKR